ncbi:MULTISPECIES: translation initiation factor IF-3 [unclassified Uliginosibacterium]|uniref:translation initiation factor IF-3 n=1 Tax=unclassified Uliginosibacterium TaxID=2621521 RepID=UPI000C7E2440|nr:MULTISPECIES: translation initiation factor IF-3 [unclassified Uliginosibacterium]MDO6388330.1 translation initiation factor IF-3 [Uliginosibacterium sp. 31-12]PLK47239.1 translation initiation factor IF-3 [Uliginosibacterium sp. TH139]
MAQEKNSHRINREIGVPEVRLVGEEGEQLGVVPTHQALAMAEEAEVDLVEIAPQAKPPVCRLMDYGKFKYQEQKRAHEAKQKQKQIQVKEVKLRPATDENDYQIKMRNMVRFLEEGDKVKVTLRYRGREMAHQEFGIRQLERIKADLGDTIVVEQFPKLEGRQLIMVIAPKKKV